MQSSDKDGAHQRAAPRIKIFQPAELRCGTEAPCRVHLLNISTGGALIYADAAPEVGTQVQLACGKVSGRARVQWRDGHRFGVAFAEPIAAAKIDALVRDQATLREAMAQHLVVR